MNKKIKSIILFTLILFLNNGFSQQYLDRIIAIVDDDIILESEVTQSAYYMAMQSGVDPVQSPEKYLEIKKLVLQNLISSKLLLIQADKDTIEADARQVDSYLQQDLNRIIQQVGGEEKIEQTLGMPMSKFRRTRRQEIENDYRIGMVREQKFANIMVSRREVENFYKTHKDSIGNIKETVDISHILITAKPGESAKKEAFQKIKDLRKRILDGEDFATLAKQYSEDPGSASKGGDLGFVSRSTLVREYAEAALQLEPGEISDIVETNFGYHIIRLEEKRGDKIHTTHILITIKPNRDDEIAAAEKIKQIHTQLVNGSDFEEMVKEYSEDESTNKQGGHLGRFEVEQLRNMAKEFVYALKDVEPGNYSEPIKTQYGFHVLKLNAIEGAREYDIEKDWDIIESMALEYKKQQEFKKWLDEIKNEVYVEVKETEYKS
ncbi:peptidylprolyl isomerase [candidate division KSB1 bacterium]|nr:peptidylprolyl isomerase [candidate division KSB1 bacterium]